MVGTAPDRRTDLHVVDGVCRQRAVGDRFDVVGTMTMQSHLSGAIHREPDSCPPPQSIGSSGHLLDGHVPVETGQSVELLGD